MIRVLFVCLGNICRSPMAEAIFRHLVQQKGLGDRFEIDSAGTGDWHIGEHACSGTRRVLAQHGLRYEGRARQVRGAEMSDPASYVIAMDASNVRDLVARFGPHPRLRRLLEYATQTSVRDVPDPYYEGNFDLVFELIRDGCEGLLEAIIAVERLQPA